MRMIASVFVMVCLSASSGLAEDAPKDAPSVAQSGGLVVPAKGDKLTPVIEGTKLKASAAGVKFEPPAADGEKPRAFFFVELDRAFSGEEGCAEIKPYADSAAAMCKAFVADYASYVDSFKDAYVRGFRLIFRDARNDGAIVRAGGKICQLQFKDVQFCIDALAEPESNG